MFSRPVLHFISADEDQEGLGQWGIPYGNEDKIKQFIFVNLNLFCNELVLKIANRSFSNKLVIENEEMKPIYRFVNIDFVLR